MKSLTNWLGLQRVFENNTGLVVSFDAEDLLLRLAFATCKVSLLVCQRLIHLLQARAIFLLI